MVCRVCNEEKDLDRFQEYRPGFYRKRCKDCKSLYDQRRKANLDNTPAEGRECYDCKEYKDASEFTTHRGSPSGLYSHCNECRSPRVRKYYENNRGKCLNDFNIRRSLTLQSDCPDNIKEILIEVYGFKCMKPDCPKSKEDSPVIHLDHIIPISKGGLHMIDNLQLLCRFCNISKRDRDTIDYRPFKIESEQWERLKLIETGST